MRRDARDNVVVQNHARAQALAQLGHANVRAGWGGKPHHAYVRDSLSTERTKNSNGGVQSETDVGRLDISHTSLKNPAGRAVFPPPSFRTQKTVYGEEKGRT